MPLPAGVTTFTLTGDELDATGAAGIPGTRGTLVPVDATGNPVRIVHLASGTEIVPAAVPFTIAADGTWTVGPLPYTDQAGLSVVGFQYKVTWNVPAWRASPGDKQFSVPGGTTSPVLYSTVTASPTVPTVLVPAGPTGATGPVGPGVAAGGTTGQALVKTSGTDYATAWATQVASVVGQSGVVTGAQIAADPALKAAYVTYLPGAGDGVTDDTTTINAALTALPTGGVGRLPSGKNYLISAPLIVKSSAILDATGATITLKAGSNCNMLQNASVTPVTTAADGAITSGSNVVTTALGAQATVGQTVVVAGAGGNGNGPLVGKVTARTATTVTLTKLDGANANATATVSAATVTLYNRDSNIKIVGGTWARGANNGTAGYQQHSLFLRHIDNLTVDIEGGTSSNGKFMVAAGDVTDYRLSARNLNTSSDGIHVTGPALRGEIGYVSGTTQDDMVAFTCQDYPTFQDVAGDIKGVKIGTIMPAASKEALKLLAGSGRTIDAVSGGYICGTTTSNGVWIGDDTAQASTTGGTYGDIDLGTVSVVPGASSNTVALLAPSANRIRATIIDTARTAAGVSVNITGTSTATINLLELVGSTFGGPLSQGVLLNSSTVTVSKLVLDRCQSSGAVNIAATATGTLGHLVLRGCLGAYTGNSGWVFVNGGTIGDITLRDCDGPFNGGNSGAVVYQLAGTAVSRVKISGGTYSGANSGWRGTSGISGTQVTFDACVFSNFTRIANCYGTATLELLNPTVINCSLQAIFCNTGPLTVRGSGVTTSGTFTTFLRAGAETVNVFLPTLPADLSQLAKVANGMVTNTNSGLTPVSGTAAGLVGPVVCDGTVWHNLASGSTY